MAVDNDDRGGFHYDENGFLVRPALIGSAQQHKVQAGYIGINGDGHIGFVNLTHSYYFAFGHDEFNPIAGRRTDIRAHMGAVEASIDRNWLRFRLSGFFATGDNDWTDCDRLSNGPFTELERLTHERSVFFSGPYADSSMGQEQMKVEVQTAPLCQGTTSSTGQPRTMMGCLENRRWTYRKVTYAILNVQGTCNNRCGRLGV